MLTSRTRVFLGILAFAACTLVGVSVGFRWHVYRAYASKYARQEVEHTFDAAHFLRAASNPGYAPDAPEKALSYRRQADMHAKAAREAAQLREFYERSW